LALEQYDLSLEQRNVPAMNCGCLSGRIDLGAALLPRESLDLVTQRGCDVGHFASSRG
jgi:hypothetical protein